MAKKTTTKEKLPTATELGWQLREIREEMNRLKAIDTKITALFKAACKAEKVKEAGGYRLNINPYGKLVVADEKQVLQWAKDYPNALKIDTTKAHEILKLAGADPLKHGFTFEETVRVEAVKDHD